MSIIFVPCSSPTSEKQVDSSSSSAMVREVGEYDEVIETGDHVDKDVLQEHESVIVRVDFAFEISD